MRATFKLLNSYFWKTIYGPIMVFLFPPILMIIMGNIMRLEYILPGIISLVTVLISVQVMPLGIMELKNSTLFKYIGSTPVNPRRFIVSVLAYYVQLIAASIMIVIFISMIAFSKKVFPGDGVSSIYSGLATASGFFSFLFANLIHMVMSLAIGLAIAVFAKTPQQSLTIGLIILIPSMFLSGMVISVDIIAQSKAMQWISRLIPFRYTTGNIIVSMTALNQIGDLMDALSSDPQKSLSLKRLIFNIVATEDTHHHLCWIDTKAKQNMTGLVLRQDGKTFWNINSNNKLSDILINLDNNTFTINNDIRDLTNIKDRIPLTINDISRLITHPQGSQKALDTWFQSGDKTLFKEIFLKPGALVASDNNMFSWHHGFGVRKIPDVELIKQFMIKFFKGENSNPDRFIFIWQNFIVKGDFEFINLFMKQNVILFTVAERVLNTIIPILVTIVATIWSIKKFKWSSR